jgi:hypothetical protein
MSHWPFPKIDKLSPGSVSRLSPETHEGLPDSRERFKVGDAGRHRFEMDKKALDMLLDSARLRCKQLSHRLREHTRHALTDDDNAEEDLARGEEIAAELDLAMDRYTEVLALVHAERWGWPPQSGDSFP